MSLKKCFGILEQTNKVLKSSACHVAVKELSLPPQHFRGFLTSARHNRIEDGHSKNFSQTYLPALMEFTEIRCQLYKVTQITEKFYLQLISLTVEWLEKYSCSMCVTNTYAYIYKTIFLEEKSNNLISLVNNL